jgi:prepilin-type N-terminal cleavage/methylation domain-containing protein
MRRAFTFVELLVSVAILTTLLSLLLPAIQSARAAARAVQCQSNLHQLGIAMEQAESLCGRVASYRVADRSLHTCPEPHTCQDWSRHPAGPQSYFQPPYITGRRLKRQQLTVDTPSAQFAIVSDCALAHRGLRMVLYLDWHVDSVGL